MESIRCPYCDCRVRLSDVETDDGTCPECGAPLMGSMLFGDSAAEDLYDDDDAHGFRKKKSAHGEDDSDDDF
ncbi:MAG: hypothetical protein HN742_06495 [Lentisphaerae bacterium]|jgi:hypothetical protein|nr:hypothetical protein [Lentisphaerota bacterium]MBT4818098.1 hypothetical protein [Lentisphaerota bacterium]MBT5610056.1 hypothetical protein [Lentisphaerota bacterium]MBT7055544.1 hypothetical protein [Lentisphaerota bacterium]MBT7841501.1 hypothetical protein [Lentisphaerota bacterium]